MTKHQLRLWLRVWHRRFGIVLAILVLLVSVTGILINHSDRWQLVHKPVQAHLLLDLYGIEIPAPVSYPAGEHWLSQVGGSQLFVDRTDAGQCRGNFAGALTIAEGRLLVACDNELVHLTGSGEILERLGAIYGVPSPIDRLGYCDNRPCLNSAGNFYLLDLDNLRWSRLEATEFTSAPAVEPPAEIAKVLQASARASGLNWERVLLDLHSGRLFGLGPWLMDLLAIGLILIACSGLTLWLMSGNPGMPARPHRRKIKRRSE